MAGVIFKKQPAKRIGRATVTVENWRQNPPQQRGRWGDDRQPLIEACLLQSLGDTPAEARLVRRDPETGVKVVTTEPVNVVGDEDFSASSGERVIAGWLGGCWRAIRKSGDCSDLATRVGCLDVLKDLSYDPVNCRLTKTFVRAREC